VSRLDQENEILEYLQAGNSLTQLQALGLFGSLRLSARIFNLRQAGWNIQTNRVATDTGKYIAEYFMP